jgi:hypothetical protein
MPEPENLPTIAQEVTSAFLGAADELAPGLVEGLYVTGSLALGDFQEQSSDVDFVAVVSDCETPRAWNALSVAHSRVRARFTRPELEGTHISRQTLVAGPDSCVTAPCAMDGRFDPSGRHAVNPVTWHELVDHGVPIRGPRLHERDVWYDPDALSAWTRANVQQYWQPWSSRYAAAPAEYDGQDWPVAWGVLGICRLHYTLATGRITSKTGAGKHGLDAFEPRWHDVLSEALRIRSAPDSPPTYPSPRDRHRDAVAFMRMAFGTFG